MSRDEIRTSPGPWRVVERDGDPWVIADGNGFGVVVICQPVPIRREQQRLNARLIAAAPEMLAEIRRLRRRNWCAVVNWLALAAFTLALTAGIAWQLGRWDGQGYPRWDVSPDATPITTTAPEGRAAK